MLFDNASDLAIDLNIPIHRLSHSYWNNGGSLFLRSYWTLTLIPFQASFVTSSRMILAPRQWVIWVKLKAPSKVIQDSTVFRDFDFLVEIPPEINAAQVSRQQFTSKAATAFLPVHQNRDAISLKTGPHWSQLIPGLVN